MFVLKVVVEAVAFTLSCTIGRESCICCHIFYSVFNLNIIIRTKSRNTDHSYNQQSPNTDNKQHGFSHRWVELRHRTIGLTLGRFLSFRAKNLNLSQPPYNHITRCLTLIESSLSGELAVDSVSSSGPPFAGGSLRSGFRTH
jgi:hypothetical protein